MSVKLENIKSLLNANTSHGFQVNLRVKTILFLLMFFLSYPMSVMAYVGPGAGITALGALWAVIIAILFAVGGFLVWPIRAMLRRRKRTTQSESPDASESDKKSNE